MELPNQYYPDFIAMSVEELWLSMARKAVDIQKSNGTNPQGDIFVAIDVDENEEVCSVTFDGLEGNFSSEGKLLVVNPYVDAFSAGTGLTWPFNATNLMQALVDLGIFLANAETDITKQASIEPVFVFSYGLSSSGEISAPHITIDLSAESLPLILTPAGSLLATGARPWLSGTVVNQTAPP